MSGRTLLWRSHGYDMVNPRWSWCGVNHDTRVVVFQVWVDKKQPNSSWYTMLDTIDWQRDFKPPMNDALCKIDLLRQGYQLVVSLAECLDVDADEQGIARKTVSIQRPRPASWMQLDDRYYCKFV